MYTDPKGLVEAVETICRRLQVRALWAPALTIADAELVLFPRDPNDQLQWMRFRGQLARMACLGALHGDLPHEMLARLNASSSPWPRMRRSTGGAVGLLLSRRDDGTLRVRLYTEDELRQQPSGAIAGF